MLAGRNAAPDGYSTLTVGGSGPMAINPGLGGKKLPYDPLADFIPGARPVPVAAGGARQSSANIDSFRQLVESAKRKPGTEKWGVAGLGTSPHLAGELIKAKAQSTWWPCPTAAARDAQRPAGRTGLRWAWTRSRPPSPTCAARRLKRSPSPRPGACRSCPTCRPWPRAASRTSRPSGWAGFLPPLHAAGRGRGRRAGHPPRDVRPRDPGGHDRSAARCPTCAAAVPSAPAVKAEVPKRTELIVATGIKVDQ